MPGIKFTPVEKLPKDNPPVDAPLDKFQEANKELAQRHFDEFTASKDILDRADNMIKNSALDAVTTIVELAQAGSTERVRMEAAKYLVERALGPASKVDSPESELENLIKTMQNRADADAKDKQLKKQYPAKAKDPKSEPITSDSNPDDPALDELMQDIPRD